MPGTHDTPIEFAEYICVNPSTRPSGCKYPDRADSTAKEIDQLVYQIYGITDEERKIIEGN